MTPLIGGVIEAGLKILDRVLPDPTQKLAAQLELLKLQQAGEFKALEADLQLALAQTEVNKVEAASADPFKSNWRPAAGWICVLGLAYQFLLQPLLAWGSTIQGYPAPPVLELGDLYGLLFGMLGLGAYRSVERVKGKA
ncbi:Holin of 3TMs, for gene-transfer release [uncultured Caudovirales phage]|uniref:Holin of 3TMs, for gene-transfer release n=1 Tax=uncultured Caudovirales phage TaxID=2100421 RepID=A0A6J5NS82_9CAUD|nr:Holin of 3TMs, for gene-transfer release [uncultured Caudovirales phage]